ncbi:MAG TPA: P63C domain-containing protein, partial [Candidatus Dormibacteraeota bacterium]|nr:P63C domain-containing protein [Candidatus Dormibacteraeota bacterium]
AIEGAKAMSALGAAKGGLARAKALTPERRSEIARAAVQERWAKQGRTPLPRATHEGTLVIGEMVIPCAVLENGQRVLTQSGFMKALGRARQAKGRQYYDADVNMPAFLTAKNLKPFISSDLEVASSQIEFYTVRGTRAFGYAAELLPKVCGVFLDADEAKALGQNQKHIAVQAKILIRGLAHVGIVALVDEATGYQDERARDALAQILQAFIAKELRAWIPTFPADFYKELFRLRNIPYKEDVKRPQYIGHLTNDLIYARLAPGVLDELRKLTPRNEKGMLKSHLHRRLTKDLGHPKLLQHLSAVTALMKASETWRQFMTMVDRALPRYKHLPLFDGLEPKESDS